LLGVLLGVYQKCECLDFRDKIYALLSLASDINVDNGFQPDYSLSKLEVLVAVLICYRDSNMSGMEGGDGYPYGLAEKVCEVLEINGRELLIDIPAVATVLNKASRPSGNAMATPRIDGFQVYFLDESIVLETTKIMNSDGKEGMLFTYSRQDDDDNHIYYGLGTTAIKAGQLVLRAGLDTTGVVGFYEGNSFRVTSRCLSPSWRNVKFGVEHCQYLEPSVFVGEALQVVKYQTKGWSEEDMDMRYCDMSMHQFLDITFLEQLFREEYNEEADL
jgi:hypothetical protein